MVRQQVYIPGYEWAVTVFYAATCFRPQEIVQKLQRIGIYGEDQERALNNLLSCQYNTGLTFTSPAVHESVVVIGLAECPAEYADSIDHEKQHLVQHIGKALGLDPYDEGVCYLAGAIGKALNPVASLFSDGCQCSKNKVKQLKYRSIWN